MIEEVPPEVLVRLIKPGKYRMRVYEAKCKTSLNGKKFGMPYLWFKGVIVQGDYVGREIFVYFPAWTSEIATYQAWNLGLIVYWEWAKRACELLYPGRIYEVEAKIVKHGSGWYNSFELKNWENKGRHP